MVKLDNKHWEELIINIIDAIGTDAFLRLVAAIVTEPYILLAEELKNLADEHTREQNEEFIDPDKQEWPIPGKETDEWKHEAMEAMKLKR